MLRVTLLLALQLLHVPRQIQYIRSGAPEVGCFSVSFNLRGWQR